MTQVQFPVPMFNCLLQFQGIRHPLLDKDTCIHMYILTKKHTYTHNWKIKINLKKKIRVLIYSTALARPDTAFNPSTREVGSSEFRGYILKHFLGKTKNITGTGEMTLLLKALHVLLENMGLIPSTDMMGSQLFIYYSKSRESNAFFRCLPQVPYMNTVQRHTCRKNTQTYKNK